MSHYVRYAILGSIVLPMRKAGPFKSRDVAEQFVTELAKLCGQKLVFHEHCLGPDEDNAVNIDGTHDAPTGSDVGALGPTTPDSNPAAGQVPDHK